MSDLSEGLIVSDHYLAAAKFREETGSEQTKGLGDGCGEI
jgi:hypothetical protein